MKEWFYQPAPFIYLNLRYKVDSRGKSKLALMIFLSLPPLPHIFYLLNCSGCTFQIFFLLTIYCIFISLEMAAAGSLINGSKSCFCQSQTNKNPSVSISLFVLAFLKQALFPSKHHWRVMHQYPWVFQQRDFFIQWCPGQKFLTGSWTGLSLQLWRARAEKRRERDVVLGRLRKSWVQNVLGRSVE